MDISIPNSDNLNEDSLLKNKLETLQRIAGSKNPTELPDDKKAEYEKAARGFESMFLNMLYKQMKETLLDNEKPEGSINFGADTISGYSDMMLADELSKAGQGIGIAKMIYKQLTGDELKPITQEFKGVDIPRTADRNAIEKRELPKENRSLSPVAHANSFLGRVSNRIRNYNGDISQASKVHNVPENLIKAIITAESAGKHDAISHAGAKGLMQLMDGTAKDMGVNNPFDPRQNIQGGTKYISKMLNMFNNDLDLALAAYNAGPGNVQKYEGIPPFDETQAYVKKVRKLFDQYERMS